MPIKTCVGAVLYDDVGRIFLMTSPKWKGYLVPGGRIEEGESEEEALRREIREELGIKITDLYRAGESVKLASSDFTDPTVEFHFKSYFARVESTNIEPNHEITEYGWFTLAEARQLPLLDSTRNLVEQFRELWAYKKKEPEK
ncbi:MAG: NUDIX domain-containing protein [Nanoarchaeota archaeon]